MSTRREYNRSYRASESEGYSEDIRDNPFGIDTHDIEDTSSDIHSHSPHDILASSDLNTSEYRIVHIESIIRHDLRANFLQTQEHMLSKLRDELHYSESEAPEVVQPRIAFHGTQNKNVPTIVAHGLTVPDRNNIPGTRRAKKGIYTSPSAMHALAFSDPGRSAETELPGLKLVVCAVVLGRIYLADNDRLLHSAIPEGYDSIKPTFSPEYVVEIPSQVLPLYIVHLDKGPGNARSLLQQPIKAQSRREAAQRRVNPLFRISPKKSTLDYGVPPLKAH